ncbi:MAG: hypothetical protein KF886_06895 [Candidatus Hydrogenedentes bacterium]|nr:hypothetical protein [Candidatus Hydrogenedentota bacterium]
MNWNKDPDKAFPARHPREPGGLRQDILDEIADHLACAAERELERGNDDEESVRRRVLEQFGDPDAIARKLWWDHMREIIMREWIQTGVMVVLAVAGIAGVAFMGLMLRQFGATNEAVLVALSQQNAGEARLATLELEFRRGSEDGPLASGVEVTCYGQMFGDERGGRVDRRADDSGILRFGPMQPGVYKVECKDPQSGLTLYREATIFAGVAPVKTLIVTPDVVPEEVQIEFESPVSRDAEKQVLGVRLESEWQHGDDVWQGAQESFWGPDSGKALQEYLVSPRSHSALPPRREVPLVVSDYVSLAKYPVRISGAPANSHTAVLIRNTGGRWSADERYKISFELLGNGAGRRYRAMLAAELKDELQDWALLDQMTAQGLSVTKELASAIRRAFPERRVTSTTPVPESTTGHIDPRGYFTSDVDRSQVFEELSASNDQLRYIEIQGEQTAINFVWSPLFALPAPVPTVADGAKRVVLAFYVSGGRLSEFNNPLEAWPVQNDVFDMIWPRFDELSKVYGEGGENLLLQDEPIDVLGREILQEGGRWQFIDITESLRNTNALPKAILLKWKYAGKDYKNTIGVVSAEAKTIENEHRRPLWLVLGPKEEAGAAN